MCKCNYYRRIWGEGGGEERGKNEKRSSYKIEFLERVWRDLLNKGPEFSINKFGPSSRPVYK